ncbi:MAG TPA: tryptophan synthase subunit alpha [Rhodothermales bacterium]|nr:tryptophan synthase subunit alpha [Rhodothermales bacterium]
MIRSHLEGLIRRGDKAMGLFVTTGYPERNATVPLMRALADGDADFIELGMPFSDPVGEGIPIQRSSEIALRNGVTIADAFEATSSFKTERATPVLLMGYANPIHAYGAPAFCRSAVDAGVDGIILADISLESADLIGDAADASGLELVFLIAPGTPDERIARIDEAANGFVYAVSTSGLTGDSLEMLDPIQRYLARARGAVTRNPLLVGFGIDRHTLARELCRHTDGFIVGSALIRRIESLWANHNLGSEERLRGVTDFALELRHGERQLNTK